MQRSVDEVRELWREQSSEAFPDDCRGQAIDGIDLVLLDSTVAGCIDSWIAANGRLDKDRLAILQKCQGCLAAICPLLKGEARRYYEKWVQITRLALRG